LFNEIFLSIFPVNIFYFNQYNLPYYSSLPFPLTCIDQQFSVHFIVSYRDMMYFNIIHTLSFSFSFPVSLKGLL
jgi:hypothetical protein